MNTPPVQPRRTTTPPVLTQPVQRTGPASAASTPNDGLLAASDLSRCARLPAMAREMCYRLAARSKG